MPINTIKELDAKQVFEIQALLVRCREDAPLTLTFPYEGSDLCLLYYDEKGALLSAAAFTHSAEGQYECSAFTDPARRNQGLFSDLLETALKLLPEESDILFFSDGNCPGTEKTLEALEVEFLDKEYFMELSPEELRRSFQNGGGPVPAVSKIIVEDDIPTLFYQSACGQTKLLLYPNTCYLCSLEIQEKFRGLGHGEALLRSVLADLAGRTSLPVLLQVSESNEPALNLYKKTGFQITETLSCYLY